jgi:hypothetical protein
MATRSRLSPAPTRLFVIQPSCLLDAAVESGTSSGGALLRLQGEPHHLEGVLLWAGCRRPLPRLDADLSAERGGLQLQRGRMPVTGWKSLTVC